MSARAPHTRSAVITLCSAARVDHVRHQLAAVSTDDGTLRIVVWLGGDQPPSLDAEVTLHVPPGREGLRLAAGRNAGAEAALTLGASLLVFLDADCIPGADLLRRYGSAAAAHPDAVLCGPVTYLPPGAEVTGPGALARLTEPHPARPAPADGTTRLATADEYALFWSLSFAVTASVWHRAGGFDPGYEGYGGEDTDYAFRLRERGIPLRWVGGAHAYHQYHDTQSPPWQHLDDILRNGARFAGRWGCWPMIGWLEAFRAGGAVVQDGAGDWRRVPDEPA